MTLSTLVGCVSGVDGLRYDHPAIRERQKQSLRSVQNDSIAGRSLKDFFNDRIGLIGGKEGIATGRAVPVSRDGYFLTAWHVVDQPYFELRRTRMLRELPMGTGVIDRDRYFRDEKFPGRVVWKDPVRDLALVHFSVISDQPFHPVSSHCSNGTEVFAAASGLNSGTLFLPNQGGLRDGVGNGPYATAGHITACEETEGEIREFSYQATLVARGGMSGGAVVESGGRLCGIITGARFFLHPAVHLRTTFGMLEARDLLRLIAGDRHSSKLRPVASGLPEAG